VREAQRLRQLEEENRKLKQLVAEQALDIVGFKACCADIYETTSRYAQSVAWGSFQFQMDGTFRDSGKGQG
jgi:hypothetical protein